MCTATTLRTVPRSKSRRWVTLDHRKRVAIGQFARAELYLLTVDEQNVITLTPADVVPVPAPPVKRTPRKRTPKKAAAAAAEKPQEQE
jgi:hypothetical protein